MQMIPKLRQIFAAKAELENLHPLKSLSEIMKDPALKRNLLTIKQDHEKWVGRNIFLWGFVKGFLPNTAEKLQSYDQRSSLVPYLPGFARSIGLNAQQEQRLTALAQARQWEQFVIALSEM